MRRVVSDRHEVADDSSCAGHNAQRQCGRCERPGRLAADELDDRDDGADQPDHGAREHRKHHGSAGIVGTTALRRAVIGER